jgi:hypothetical protein
MQRAKTEVVMMMAQRANISVMLGTGAGFATKKTAGF